MVHNTLKYILVYKMLLVLLGLGKVPKNHIIWEKPHIYSYMIFIAQRPPLQSVVVLNHAHGS